MHQIDIETKPRTDLVAKYLKPFDPADVKLGNLKDPVKIAEKIEEARSSYETNAIERAALNPVTAEICVIGLKIDGHHKFIEGDSEAEMLREWWSIFSITGPENSFAYWSGNGNPTGKFDPDMLIKRSWILGVKVPQVVFDGRYLSRRLVDAAARFCLYQTGAFCSLSDAGHQLGLFESNPSLHKKDKEHDLVTGENFHKYWDGSPQEKALATSYLTNDLDLLDGICARIF